MRFELASRFDRTLSFLLIALTSLWLAASAAAETGTEPTPGDAAAAPTAAKTTDSADSTDAADSEEGAGRIEALEEKVDTLADEMGRLESIFVVPENLELSSFNGLGPAASKVYKRESGLSIGGYGEVRLRGHINEGDNKQDDIFDALRAVLYVGYKFNENWVVNSEFEFEHAGTGGDGSVSTEFLTLDYLYRDELNARAGLVLIPMGLVNEIHEPTFYYGAERPEVERLILPSTWRENGAGVFGTFAERVEYRAYVVNGFRGEDFTSSGLRGGRQKGSEALANDFAFVVRVDVDVTDGLMLGGSFYTGDTGQNQTFVSTNEGGEVYLPDARLNLYELHGVYQAHGLTVRALWTQAFLNQAGRLSRELDLNVAPGGSIDSAIASRMQGFYTEIAYDVLPLFCPETKASLEPFFRFEKYNTQDRVQDAGVGFVPDESKDVDLYVAGLQFKPIPQVVLKFDYRRFNLDHGAGDDQLEALIGYVF
jgi:hypothetical protein